MKILGKDYRKGKVDLSIDSKDDLWYISYIIDNGDSVSSLTERKIKIGDDDERKKKIVKKKVRLSISVEKIQFSKHDGSLRISGKITEGTDDISAGDYHTLSIDEGDKINIIKKEGSFLEFQKEKIEEAIKDKPTSVMLCAIDRGEACFALLKKYGYEILSKVTGEVEKKDFKENITKDFFKETGAMIKEYQERHSLKVIVIGTVGFWKDDVKKKVEDHVDIKRVKILYTSCNDAGENGIREMITNKEIKEYLQEERFAIESDLVTKVMEEISKEGNAEYGIDEVHNAAELGAVEKLLVTDGIISSKREDDSFGIIEDTMKSVDKNKGKVILISSEHEAGKQLDGLGGIAAITRFKI